MNSHTQIIIILLVLIIAILLAFSLFLAYLIFKNQRSQQPLTEDKPNQKDKEHIYKTSYICTNHPDVRAAGTCAICEQGFCEDCLREHEKLYFCSEHYDIYLKNQWVEIETVKTTPDHPEKGVYIYNFKQEQWSNKKVPTYIVTHYKINVEGDFVESYIKLFVRKDDQELLTRQLELTKPDQQ